MVCGEVVYFSARCAVLFASNARWRWSVAASLCSECKYKYKYKKVTEMNVQYSTEIHHTVSVALLYEYAIYYKFINLSL